jgi:hypothetical protein
MTDYTLKLDFDGKQTDYEGHVKRIKLCLNIIGFIRIKDVNIMQTKKGFHTYLTVSSNKTDLLPKDIVCLQSLLGSDFKRECFNFLRVKSGMLLNENWNVLFSKKWDSNGVKSVEHTRPDLKNLFLARE